MPFVRNGRRGLLNGRPCSVSPGCPAWRPAGSLANFDAAADPDAAWRSPRVRDNVNASLQLKERVLVAGPVIAGWMAGDPIHYSTDNEASQYSAPAMGK